MRRFNRRESRRRRHAARRWATVVALVLAHVGWAAPAVAQEGLRADLGPRERALAEAVVRTSPELAALRAELEAARARADAAGFAAPPVLSGEVEEVPGGYDFAGAAFRVEVGREFLVGGRGGAARALAAAGVAAAEIAVAAAERRLGALAFRELSRAAAGTRAARRLAAEDSLLLGAEGAVRDRFSVSEARYVDVLRLRTERLRVQTERADALADARAAREALTGLAGPEGATGVIALLGSLLATVPDPAEDTPLPPLPSPEALLEISGELRLADVAVERARTARALVLAEQRPRLSASLGAQRIVEDGDNRFGPVLGASMTLPFGARRGNQAAALAAEREVRAAEATRAAVIARVRADVAGAMVRYEAARERLAVYDAALIRGAREERESALAAYRTGEMTLIELLDFERALARAEIDGLRARADAAEAYANLISSVEGGR